MMKNWTKLFLAIGFMVASFGVNAMEIQDDYNQDPFSQVMRVDGDYNSYPSDDFMTVEDDTMDPVNYNFDMRNSSDLGDDEGMTIVTADTVMGGNTGDIDMFDEESMATES